MNELQPCISPKLAAYGRSPEQGYAVINFLISAKHARMQWATAKVSRFRLNASSVVSGGNKCAKGAQAARVAGHSKTAGVLRERESREAHRGWCSQQRPR